MKNEEVTHLSLVNDHRRVLLVPVLLDRVPALGLHLRLALNNVLDFSACAHELAFLDGGVRVNALGWPDPQFQDTLSPWPRSASASDLGARDETNLLDAGHV